MPLVALGLSHKTAPPDIRNRHALPSDRVAAALIALRDYTGVNEAAIVSTCNRVEIYADVDDFERGVGELKNFLTTYRDMGVEDFDQYLYTLLGAQAVEQLLRVAGGLDSMVVGEAEILGQVREAMAVAQAAGTIGPRLHRLFRVALETGKRARSQTAIGRDVVSLGAAAVELASRHRKLQRSRAMVIGAGNMASIVAKHLAARGVTDLVIVNRSPERARALADQVGGSAIGLDEIPKMLADVDLVVSATGRGSYVITSDMLARAELRGRPLLIIDVAVPRDVEPRVSGLSGVEVYELADLRQIVERTLGKRRAEIPAVGAIVAQAAREYVKWYDSRGAGPLIARLRDDAETIRAAEITRLFARLPELGEAERASIEAASVTIVNRLLHEPVTRLRESMARAPEQTSPAFDLTGLGQELERHLSERMRSPHRRRR